MFPTDCNVIRGGSGDLRASAPNIKLPCCCSMDNVIFMETRVVCREGEGRNETRNVAVALDSMAHNHKVS